VSILINVQINYIPQCGLKNDGLRKNDYTDAQHLEIIVIIIIIIIMATTSFPKQK
jgi:hypothetical protein